MRKETLIKKLEKENAALKIKADKWDKLAEEIGKYYDEYSEESKEGDLCDIGEKAASAFGYI